MLCTVEIRSRFSVDDPPATLSPRMADRFSLQQSRVYRVRGQGSPPGLKRFVRRVLLDPVAELYRLDQSPMVSNYELRLDIRLKEGLRDPQRLAILDFQRGAVDTGFELDDIVPVRRVYVLGNGRDTSPTENDVRQLVRELANPTVNEWSLDRG